MAISISKVALDGVLKDIQANQQMVDKQLAQLDENRANLLIQRSKFEALIAALQVAIVDDAVSAKVDEQMKANDALPLTAPEGSAAADPIGITPGNPAAANEGVAESQAEPDKSNAPA